MAKSGTKSGALGALDYLTHPAAHPAPSVCAVFGDDSYLKSAVLRALRQQTLSADEAEFSLTTISGRDAQFRDLLDALATVSLFSVGRRMVIVEEADPFVTEFRESLEDYAARPFQSGVLVLEVKTWSSATRLAKAFAATGLTIECKQPNERQTKAWLTRRANDAYGVRLAAAAADALLELLPLELGILEQEVSKLALSVGENGDIDAKLVRDNVGGWRTRTTWEMIDAAADGRATAALAQMDRLIASGEKPHGLLPQMSSSLRKFAAAAAEIEAAELDRRTLPLRDALSKAGVPPFKLADAEQQLRKIGRRRAKELTGWLLAADLAIKSYNSSDDRARMELERLIVRLSDAAGKLPA